MGEQPELFQVEVRGNTLLLTVQEGQLSNVETVESFARELAQVSRAHSCEHLITDFARVTFLATPVVNALIQARKHFKQVVVVGLSEHLRRAFSLMKLDEALELRDDVADGLNALPDDATSDDT